MKEVPANAALPTNRNLHVEISVESVGYRSAFIGAVLSSLDCTEASPSTMRVTCIVG